VCGQSETTVLESNGDTHEIYGYIYFGDRGLGIAYRSIEEDMCDANVSEAYGPIFATATLSKSPAQWLQRLAIREVLDALLSSVVASVTALNTSLSQALSAVQAVSSTPLQGIDEALENVARRLDYRAVLEEWHDAQESLHTDPAEAATRSCRLLETLCKRIIEDRNIATPRRQTLPKLFKAAVQQLRLSPDQQTSDDLRSIASGIATIAHGIGTLRTHRGTAHGQSQRSLPLAEAEARLAVDAAGILSTFLMQVLHSKQVD
jgi:hypothetical protein